MKLRNCRSADIASVQEIYAHHVLTGVGTFEEQPPSVAAMQRRFVEIESQGCPFLVAADDAGRITGFAYAAPFRLRSAYRFTCENAVYVAAPDLRRGVGRALMLELILRSRKLGLRQMLAVIGDSANAGSIGLHASLGFKPVGTFTDVGFKFGRWVDVVLMQLKL